MTTTTQRSELTLVLGGEAGQGLQTLQLLLARLLYRAGLHLFASSEFMSRIRGGSNSTTVRAARHPVRAWRSRADLCVCFDRAALERLAGRCDAQTLLVGDPHLLGARPGLLALPLQQLAKDAGGTVYANSIVCGFLARLLDLDIALLEEELARTLAAPEEVLVRNRAAARQGWEAAAAQAGCCALAAADAANPAVHRLLLDGSQAVALGALAGGCNFIASYPMSPSTGVLIHLAKQARTHGVVVEQAEDEICAINMALGSWYAGGRALVTTSGGGFDLMAEGLSLAGAIESPLVIHLAQRPGPGTGLPTRSEQGDLEIARYSGHGEFPRAILAPGSPEEALTCTSHAFTMAAASQAPVFVLTDQFLLDSLYELEEPALPTAPPEPHLVATVADYQRYAPADNGVSPRGIPGWGEGRVCVDSDEHDPDGRITEDFRVRTAMVDKRLAKLELLRGELAIPPRLIGPRDFDRLLVGWGSTAGVVEEALQTLQPPRTAFLHCVQLWPLPPAIGTYLAQAKRIVVIENNATGQFARLLRGELGCHIADCWLQYDGQPFSLESILARLRTEVSS